MIKPTFQDLKPMPVSCMSNRKPIIVGHRGAAALAPENTPPAFEAALYAGADGIEFDVQRTTDGHLVIFHDEEVARTSNGVGFLPDMSLKQLQALDVGGWFDGRFRGTRVLTLRELFDWIRGNNLLLFLELKEPFRFAGIEQQVADLIREYDFVERTQVRSFYHKHLHEFHRIAPEIPISELWRTHLPDRDEITYRTINIMAGFYNRKAIADFHGWERTVTAWVVDDLDMARQLSGWGIDGITTNNPLHILKLFDSA